MRRALLLGLAIIGIACNSSTTGPTTTTYTAGNFNLDKLTFSINGTQADGSNWDLDGSAPDPIITIYLNGTSIFSTQLNDLYSGTLNVNHRVAITDGDVLEVKLLDEDITTPDFIGMMRLTSTRLFTYNVGDVVPLDAETGTVSIKSVTLYLTQVK